MGNRNMENARVDKAYNYIYQHILSGEFPLGAALSEVQIGSNINMSRSPIREALKRLASEGIVKQYAGKGTFVTNFTLHDIEEIFDMRIMLERYCLQHTFKYVDDKMLDELESHMICLDNNSSEKDFYDSNYLFHSFLVFNCNNERAKAFYQMMSAQLDIIYKISSSVPSHDIMSRDDHLEIIHAMRSNNLELADNCLVSHLEKTRRNTIRVFNSHMKISLDRF